MYGELDEVLKYIPSKIDELAIVALHRELAGLYENARNSPSQEVTNQISDCTARLENAQETFEPEGWESTKIKIFKKIGAAKLLGKTGIENLEDEIAQLSNDPHGVSDILNRYATEIEALRQKVQQAADSLSPLFAEEESLPDNMKRVELIFDKNVSVESFGDMAFQASEWNKILKSLKNTVAEPSEDGHFWRIYKASPTVIVFFLSTPQAASMLDIVGKVLDIVVALLAIRAYQKSSESSPLDKTNKDKILEVVSQYEKQKLNEEVENKVEILLQGANLTGTQKAVAKVSFTHIVKKIYNFFVEGGTVNPIDKVKETETPEEAASYRSTFKKVLTSLKLETSKPLLLAEFTKTEEEKFEASVSEPVAGEIKEQTHRGRGRPKTIRPSQNVVERPPEENPEVAVAEIKTEETKK